MGAYYQDRDDRLKRTIMSDAMALKSSLRRIGLPEKDTIELAEAVAELFSSYAKAIREG